MTTQQNRIMMPSHRQVKVSILLDPNTGQTEIRIAQGQITHIQLLGLLMEHATAMLKSMMTMQQKPLLDGDGNSIEEEKTNAS